MAVIPQSACFPRSQPRFDVAQASRHEGAPHPIPVDSPASPDTIVYLVCNQAAQVNSLTKFFSSRSISIRAFQTAADYISSARADRTACVVLDLNLPDINGLEVQSRLADIGGPPVIFVTADSDLNSGVRAMKNGAIDFMIEPIDYKRLLAAVLAAFARDRKNRRERAERQSLLTRWGSLTPREQDVFQYTVAGFLNKQSAAELGITENTFQVHRGRVMKKMKADSLADLVRMSTRLESLVHLKRLNQAATQQDNTGHNGQLDVNWKGVGAWPAQLSLNSV